MGGKSKTGSKSAIEKDMSSTSRIWGNPGPVQEEK